MTRALCALVAAAAVLASGAAQASDSASSGMLLPDGKLLVGGRTDLGNNDAGKGYLALARYRSDGKLDRGFGRGGKVATPLGLHFGSGINALARARDGRIVAAGGTYNGRNYDFALARYRPNGGLDRSFGRRGTVTTNFLISDSARAVALQPDGKIVAAGVAGADFNGESGGSFALARYTSRGKLDPTFGSRGKVRTVIGSESGIYGQAIQSDGKIVVAGASGGSFALARYRKNGTLDPSFGTGGKVVGPSGVALAVVLRSGRILVAGREAGRFALVRYTSGGSLDATFGLGGLALGPAGEAFALAVQSNGKIVAAGTSSSSHRFRLARFSANGVIDASFGTGGSVTTGFPAAYSIAHAVAVQSNGRIVAVGGSGAGKHFALARYSSDGALDSSFGKGGKVTTSFTVCQAPALHGKKLSAAKRAITSARCAVGKVRGSGRVVSQKPAAGTWHPVGTKVGITLR